MVAQWFVVIAAADKELPRVLLIGDSVYSQPGGEVAKLLKGEAEVVQVKLDPGEVLHTGMALEKLNVQTFFEGADLT